EERIRPPNSACRPTAGAGRLRTFRRQGMIRRTPAAADAVHWAALQQSVHGQAVGMGGSLVRPGRSGQALLGGPLPNIPYTDRGGSGPVDDVGGPGG
ncbi:MAG: hypothetical protein WBE17_00615, partial [Anaerolineae bacterium]